MGYELGFWLALINLKHVLQVFERACASLHNSSPKKLTFELWNSF
jgi:hypothetical protein